MKKKVWAKVLLILGGIAALIVLCVIAYSVHMHIDPEEHEYYDVATLEKEGRDYSDYSYVYMTSDISPQGLKNVYDKLLLWSQPTGKVAIKLSTGEAGNPNYLSPDLIKDLVQSVDGTIVECNTAYGGSKRAETAMHLEVAKEHGFTNIADVDIMDADGYMVIPVEGGTHLKENWVGQNLANYDYVIVLSHFKGHPMAEAAKSVSDYENHGDKMLYISVMNRMSVDCDCVSSPAEVDMHDIGILASTDPVALDQACIDLVYSAEDGQSMRQRIEGLNGLHILTHAEEIGLGNRAYELIDVDGE